MVVSRRDSVAPDNNLDNFTDATAKPHALVPLENVTNALRKTFLAVIKR